MDRTIVYATFDTQNKTWNVVKLDRECIFYGTVFQVDEWLEGNKHLYKEIPA